MHSEMHQDDPECNLLLEHALGTLHLYLLFHLFVQSILRASFEADSLQGSAQNKTLQLQNNEINRQVMETTF